MQVLTGKQQIYKVFVHKHYLNSMAKMLDSVPKVYDNYKLLPILDKLQFFLNFIVNFKFNIRL